VADLAGIGITARPLSRHFTGKVTEHGLFLGFAAWNETEIDAGADLIGATLARKRQSAARRR
jgi:GntR family transcriptional regulator/MocR family aminotransferase